MRIEYTGLRPGESSEEPLADAEDAAHAASKLRVAQARLPENGKLLDEVLAWLETPGPVDAATVRARLRRWVPEYAAPSTEAEITPLQIRTAQRP